MDIENKRSEITDLIDNIKSHSDRLTEKPTMPLLELSVLLAKITRLQEKTAVLKYLVSKDQEVSESEIEPSVIFEHEKKIEEELKEMSVSKDDKADEIEVQEEVIQEEKIEEEITEPIIESEPEIEQETEEEFESPNAEEVEEDKVELQEPIAESIEEEIQELEAPQISLEDLESKEEIPSIPDLNEQYSEEEDPSLSEQLKKQPIADLLTAIGLNERYLYANELFGGDIEDFKNVVRTLNEFDSKELAESYFVDQLLVSYGWEKDSEMVKALYSLVQRRYQ